MKCLLKKDNKTNPRPFLNITTMIQYLEFRLPKERWISASVTCAIKRMLQQQQQKK